jgi:hypothetical protein
MRQYDPLIGVRVIDDIGGWIVGNDVVEQVLQTGILELVRLSRRTNERIARSNGRNLIAGAKLGRPAEDKIKLPLSGMSVEWKIGRAGRQFGKLDLEWVSATRNTGIARRPERLGDMTTEEMKASAWRALLHPLDCSFFCVIHRQNFFEQLLGRGMSGTSPTADFYFS